jgi:hypothetical protein
METSTRAESELIPLQVEHGQGDHCNPSTWEESSGQPPQNFEASPTAESKGSDSDTALTVRPRTSTRGRPRTVFPQSKFYLPPKPTRGPLPTKNPRSRGTYSSFFQKWFGGKQGITKLLVWLAMLALGIAWTWRAHMDHKHVARKKVRLAERLRWAASYLASSCDADGRFR